VGVNKRLRLQLHLILYLLGGRLLAAAGDAAQPTGPDEGRLRTGVDDGLGLDLGQGVDLGRVHGHEPPPAILRGRYDCLGLCGGLDHRLRLRLGVEEKMSIDPWCETLAWGTLRGE
jgi:hypothetical protein